MNNGKICVSVCAETADKMMTNIKRAAEFADVIEVRFDCLSDMKMLQLAALKEFRSRFNGKLLATFRPSDRGQGGKRALTTDERLEFWTGHVFEFVDWADIEFDLEFPSRLFLRAVWDRIIWSFHAFGVVPNEHNLQHLYSRLANCAGDARADKHPDIIKIAINTDDITDALPVWKILERAKADSREVIPIAMGDAGKWTRVLGLAHGTFMTYAALDDGGETAPGQITAKDLIEIYRVKELDKNTMVYGVVGDPVSASLSTYMHNPAFASAGVNAVFIPLKVKDLGGFIRRMVDKRTREVELNFSGFSVTMPHKQAIMTYLDAIDETAEKIGAVNTVKVDDGGLTGYNTDAHGFITPLKARFGDLCDARVVVCGAGGAARACVFSLKQEKAVVTIAARDEEKARLLADELDCLWCALSKITDITRKAELADDFDIVVDATPVGMNGPDERKSLLTAEQLKGVKFVYDLVTRPVDTPIISEAKMAGVPAIGGLEMLVAQGARQFELWTEKAAPVKEMRSAVADRIKQLQK